MRYRQLEAKVIFQLRNGKVLTEQAPLLPSYPSKMLQKTKKS